MVIQRYLKTGISFVRGKEVIQRNTDIVQAANTPVCLFVLKSLASGGEKFQTILDNMQHYVGGYTLGYWKDTMQTEEVVCSTETPQYRALQPLHLQLDSKDRPLPGEEPYNEVDAMRHAICYQDNESGIPECDRKILAELNALTPQGRREQVDRQLVRGIIGLKHRLGMGVWSSQLAGELHKPAREWFQKRSVFAKQVDDIWTADLIDMSPYSRSNSDYKVWVVCTFENQNWLRRHSRNCLPPPLMHPLVDSTIKS